MGLKWFGSQGCAVFGTRTTQEVFHMTGTLFRQRLSLNMYRTTPQSWTPQSLSRLELMPSRPPTFSISIFMTFSPLHFFVPRIKDPFLLIQHGFQSGGHPWLVVGEAPYLPCRYGVLHAEVYVVPDAVGHTVCPPHVYCTALPSDIKQCKIENIIF